jgi:hypothetical protein
VEELRYIGHNTYQKWVLVLTRINTDKEECYMSYWTWLIICIPIIAGVIAANSSRKGKQ